MHRIILSVLFWGILSISNSTAQTAHAPDALAWRFTWNNFQFPITEDLSRYDYTSGGELMYVRYLNRYLNVATPLKIGKARLPINDEGAESNSVLIGSLDILGQVKLMPEKHWFYPYLLAGVGVMTEPESDYNMNPEIPLGIGLNFKVKSGVYVSTETQYRYDFGDNRNQLMHSLGLWFTLGAEDEDEDKKEDLADADLDGVPDDEDQCPNEPGEADLFGCPDKDGDGVADRYDECVDVAGYAEFSGCPDSDGDKVPDHIDECPTLKGSLANNGCPLNDRDADGVPDEKDRCPDLAGSPFLEGCPDQDNDGVADIDDPCPDTAGPTDKNGCPDSDGDGVADHEDRCPTIPGIVYNYGCPELKKEEKEVLEFAAQAVQFETGSSRLKADSKKILDQIAVILNNYPGQKLRISGHTDSIGTVEDNLDLSKRRARACYDYLVSKGIPSKRMTHHGYGESLPIADNMYAPGREKNRRVVFEIFVD